MYVKIVQSRTLANNLLEREFETEKFGHARSLLHILTDGKDPSVHGIDTLRELAVRSLREDVVQVSVDRNSPLLILKVKSSEPEFSANLNQAIIDELDALQKQFELKRMSEKKVFIENRTQTVRKELEKSEERLMQFRMRNRQTQNSPILLLEQERLTREIQVQIGVFTTLKQQLEMAKIEMVQSESLIQVLDNPNIPLFKELPSRRQVVVFVAFLGGLLGVFISFMKNTLIEVRNNGAEKIDRFRSALALRRKNRRNI